MAKKYIVQNNQITEIIYIGGCHSAKGGHKPAREPAEVLAGQNLFSAEYDTVAHEQMITGIEIHGEYHKKNFRAREKKRSATIQELVFNNFEPRNACMLTLTFASDEKNLECYEEVIPDDMSEELELSQISECLGQGNFGHCAAPVIDTVKVFDPATRKYNQLAYCNKTFKQFIQRMKYHFPAFAYVAVPAKQANGNWHYHLVCNMNYIPFERLHKLWGNGAVYFRSFKTEGVAGMWKAVRYLQRNMRLEQIQGEKGYLASKGLQRNKVYRSWVASEELQAKSIEKITKNSDVYHSYETSHDYYGISSDGITDIELSATTKYFKYLVDSSALFPKLPNAYRAG